MHSLQKDNVMRTSTIVDAQDLSHIAGGKMIVPVLVGGQPGYSVDWDQLSWDIFTGRIGVTYK